MTNEHTLAHQVLAFDVFGTVVDWHGSVAREVNALYPGVDGDAFALAWRAGYQPAMRRVMSGELGWTLIDDLHRLILDELLPRFGLGDMAEAERRHLNRVWHRLDPWPDVLLGLQRLKNALHAVHPVQRQPGPTHQHGQARRPALGLYFVGRSFPSLQA